MAARHQLLDDLFFWHAQPFLGLEHLRVRRDVVEVGQTLSIRLSPTATSGSVRPCSWTFTSVAIFGSHNRSQSSSDFFPTTRPAPPTWRRLAGATGLFAPIVRRRERPFRFANRLGVLRCRKCRRDTGLTVGTVMARSHTPLSVWFWSAYLVSSQTPGVSAVQLRRQLGLSRYQTAFQILHRAPRGDGAPGSGQDRWQARRARRSR